MSTKHFPTDLDHYTCTNEYHRFGLRKTVVCTDGVKYLADCAECFWLLDVISSYQGNRRLAVCERIQFWTLEKRGRGAVLYCQRDDGEPKCVEQEIEYTDFPFTSDNHKVKIWVSLDDDFAVLMLPSEY